MFKDHEYISNYRADGLLGTADRAEARNMAMATPACLPAVPCRVKIASNSARSAPAIWAPREVIGSPRVCHRLD